MLPAVLLSLAALAALVLFFPLKAVIRFNFSGKACDVSFKFWKVGRSLHHEFSASDLKTNFVKSSSEKASERARKKAEQERKKAEKAKAAKAKAEEAKREGEGTKLSEPQARAPETAAYKRPEPENLAAAPALKTELPEAESEPANQTGGQPQNFQVPPSEASRISESPSQNQAEPEGLPAPPKGPHESDVRRVPPPGEALAGKAAKTGQEREFSERDFLTIWLCQASSSLLWRLGIKAWNRAFHLLGVKFEDSYLQGVRARSFERTGYLAALAGGLRAVFPALEGWNVFPDWSGRVPFAVFGRCTLRTNLFRVFSLGCFSLYVAARLALHYFWAKRKYRKDPGNFELSWGRGKVVDFLSPE